MSPFLYDNLIHFLVNGWIPLTGHSRGALMFSLMPARRNAWENSPHACELRLHGAHCDVTVMHLINSLRPEDVYTRQLTTSSFHMMACCLFGGKPLHETSWLAIDWDTRKKKTLQWRNNERDGVSNNRRLDCLLNRLFRRRSKKTSKLRVTGLCEGIHKWPVDCTHKGSVTRKMVPFDDIIMIESKFKRFLSRKCVWKRYLQNVVILFHSSKMGQTLGSTSIRNRSDTPASDRCLIDVHLIDFTIFVNMFKRSSFTAVICGAVGLGLALAVNQAGGTVLQVNINGSMQRI